MLRGEPGRNFVLPYRGDTTDAAFRSSVRLARNGEYARPDERFEPNDEVALIPPVSGG